MTPFAAAQITKDRLRLWQKRNEKENRVCTPVVLLSVTHFPASGGEMVINTVEDLTDEQIEKLLQGALILLQKRRQQGN